MSATNPAGDPAEDPRRQAALARIHAKRGFLKYLGTWVILSIFFIVIWAAGGGGSFWPIWPIIGIGIGAFFMGLGAYGPRMGPPSEEQIQKEMDKA